MLIELNIKARMRANARHTTLKSEPEENDVKFHITTEVVFVPERIEPCTTNTPTSPQS